MNSFQATICCFLFIGTTAFTQSADSIETYARSLPWNTHVPEVHYTPEFTPKTPGLLITIIISKDNEILVRSFYGIVFSEKFHNTIIPTFWSSGMSGKGSSKGTSSLYGANLMEITNEGFIISAHAGTSHEKLSCSWREMQIFKFDGYVVQIKISKNAAEQGAAANPYPLRGRVEVTLSGSSPLPDSLPPYQGG